MSDPIEDLEEVRRYVSELLGPIQGPYATNLIDQAIVNLKGTQSGQLLAEMARLRAENARLSFYNRPLGQGNT